MANRLVCIAILFFCMALGGLVHDSLCLEQTLSTSEIHDIVTSSRPILMDVLGNPIKLTQDRDYERALLRGDYHAAPRATIAMISPKQTVALVAVNSAPTALLRGWSVEPLEHRLDLITEAKQCSGMWLGSSPDLWFQTALFWVSAALFFGTLLLSREGLKPAEL